MKYLNLTFFLLLIFPILGQYDLNFKIGYVNPRFEKIEPYENNSYGQHKFYSSIKQKSKGASFDIGLHKKLNAWYQHKLTLTTLYRQHNVTFNEEHDFNNDQIYDSTAFRSYSQDFFNLQLSYYGIVNVFQEDNIPISLTYGVNYDKSFFYQYKDNNGTIRRETDFYKNHLNLRFSAGVLYQKKISDKVDFFGEFLINHEIYEKNYYNEKINVVDYRFSVGINHKFNNRTRAIKDTLKLGYHDYTNDPINSLKKLYQHREKANFRNYYLFGIRVFKYWQNSNTYRPLRTIGLYPYEHHESGGAQYGKTIYQYMHTNISSRHDGYGLDLYFDRFHCSYYIGSETIDYEIVKGYEKHYNHKPPLGGTWRQYYQEFEKYYGSMIRSSKTLGIGFNLMGAGRRLKFIPTYQWQNNVLISNKVTLSQHSKHYYNKYDYAIYHGFEKWDSMVGPSNFVGVSDAYRSRRYGFSIVLKVLYGLEIQYTHLRQFDETPLFNYQEKGRTVVSTYFHQIGISYNLQIEKIPRKRKLVNLLKPNPNRTFET